MPTMAKQPSKKTDAIQELKAITSLKECPPATLVLCADAIRRDRVVGILLAHFFKTVLQHSRLQDSLTKWNSADLNDKTLRVLKQQIHHLSLFSANRFFIISEVEGLNAAIQKELLALLAALPPGVNFILHGKKLLPTSPLYKELASRKCLIEIEELKSFDLKRWVQKELAQAAITTYPDDTLNLIIEECEGQPDLITKLIEKISLYADEGALLEGELSKFLTREVGVSEFDFIDRLSERKPIEAELLLLRLLRSGKSPFPLLALLSKSFSQFFIMKYLERHGKTSHQIQQSMSLPPWLFNKLAANAKRFSLKELREALKTVLCVDSKLKNKSLGPQALFREFIEKSV